MNEIPPHHHRQTRNQLQKKRNARITYKARIPRRRNFQSEIDQVLVSTSDVYSQNEPMTVDVYPTRSQSFVRKIRNRPDNQSPWLADTSPIRRNSFSAGSTYRTPRGPDYDNKLLQPKSRLSDCKGLPSIQNDYKVLSNIFFF